MEYSVAGNANLGMIGPVLKSRNDVPMLTFGKDFLWPSTKFY
jgi:hypothetical protein